MFAVLAALAVVSAASVSAVPLVVSAEAGYGYIMTSKDLTPSGGNGLLTSLYFGYLINDSPSNRTVLSLALGYALFPQAAGTQALHSVVYGLEYAHTFFAANPVSLMVSYGLLFDLLLEGGRGGYAFGHHTRLNAGPVFSLGPAGDIMLVVGYNFVTFPYFELASAQVTYPSLSARWQLRL
jgi:hypothetical protein